MIKNKKRKGQWKLTWGPNDDTCHLGAYFVCSIWAPVSYALWGSKRVCCCHHPPETSSGCYNIDISLKIIVRAKKNVEIKKKHLPWAVLGGSRKRWEERTEVATLG